MNFRQTFEQYDWDQVTSEINSMTAADVEIALARGGNGSLKDFMALISPAAIPYLEEMAQLSMQLTQKRFGKTIQLFAPMYLSNECQNICTYCGFSLDNKIPRKTLNDLQILKEVKAMKNLGFEHVLLVTGEANKTVGIDYFLNTFEFKNKLFEPFSEAFISYQYFCSIQYNFVWQFLCKKRDVFNKFLSFDSSYI